MYWPQPTEGIVHRYDIYVDGVLVDTVPAFDHDYTIAGLLPGTTYKVSVVACNDIGCSEELSAELKTATLSEAVASLRSYLIGIDLSTTRGWASPANWAVALLAAAERVLDDGNPNNDGAAIRPLERLLEVGDAEDWSGWDHVRWQVEDLIAGIEATAQEEPILGDGTDEEGCLLKWSSSGLWPATGGSPGLDEIQFDIWSSPDHFGPIYKETTLQLPVYGDYVDVDGTWSAVLGDDLTNAVTYNFATVWNVTPHPLAVNVESDGDDSWAVYVNGLESGIWNGQQAVGPPHTFRVSEEAVLEPGMNWVTLKLIQGAGGAGFRCRFTDAHTGTPLLDAGREIYIDAPPTFVMDPFAWD